MGHDPRFGHFSNGYERVASCGSPSAGVSTWGPAVLNDGMRAVVTCESCGLRQEVARAIPEPTTFHIVCHRCELSLLVTVTQADILTAESAVGAGLARR